MLNRNGVLARVRTAQERGARVRMMLVTGPDLELAQAIMVATLDEMDDPWSEAYTLRTQPDAPVVALFVDRHPEGERTLETARGEGWDVVVGIVVTETH